MTRKCLLYSLLLIGLSGPIGTVSAQSVQLYSPDRDIQVTVDAPGQLNYQVSYKGKAILLPSPLGFEFKDEPPMGAGMAVLKQAARTVDETWKPVIADKHSLIGNHYTELELDLG
jgi:alpha-glucosidase